MNTPNASMSGKETLNGNNVNENENGGMKMEEFTWLTNEETVKMEEAEEKIYDYFCSVLDEFCMKKGYAENSGNKNYLVKTFSFLSRHHLYNLSMLMREEKDIVGKLEAMNFKEFINKCLKFADYEYCTFNCNMAKVLCSKKKNYSEAGN